MDTFDLRQYLNNNPLLQEGLLYEASDAELIKKAVAKILDIPVEDVPDSDPGEVEKPLDEIAVSTGILIASIAPVVLEAIAGMINATKREYGLDKNQKLELAKLDKRIAKKKKYLDTLDSKQFGTVSPKEEQERKTIEGLEKERAAKFDSSYGKLFKDIAHGLHSTYTSPIRAILVGTSWGLKLLKKESKLHDKDFREKLANIIYATAMCIYAGIQSINYLTGLPGVASVATGIVDAVKSGKSAVEVIKSVATFI
tara:strand:+ start:27 stop:791 length:765 start_codon:yes stop_codon:yes gene_type:complete